MKLTHGRIVRGLGGLYCIKTEDGIIECRAKGAFRHEKNTSLNSKKQSRIFCARTALRRMRDDQKHAAPARAAALRKIRRFPSETRNFFLYIIADFCPV